MGAPAYVPRKFHITETRMPWNGSVLAATSRTSKRASGNVAMNTPSDCWYP